MPTVITVRDPEGITAAKIGALRFGAMVAARGLTPDPNRERLTRPTRRKLDDSFYERVADAYRDAVARQERAPRLCVAREANVPFNTASRWIATARELGYLPPAKPGRVSA